MSQEPIRRVMSTSPELCLVLDLERGSQAISQSISERTLTRSFALDGRLLLPVEFLRLGLLGGHKLSTAQLVQLLSQCGGSAMLFLPMHGEGEGG
jgi:hypothetical protein